MSKHPYSSAPPRAFWSRSVAGTPPDELDPATPIAHRITSTSPVVSAGSCFAANISKHLRAAGFNYLVTESLHPLLFASKPAHYESLGYGVYSALYGNIYTPRQMLQLLERAYGTFAPREDRWTNGDEIVDPFRPRLPHPAQSTREFEVLRDQHFRAVRSAYERAEFFVFTLGLTEAWRSREDGAVYPACPGTIAGEFDERKHEFVNFSVDEIYDDLRVLIELLRTKNPALRVILTVSPVPLVATATEDHVLVASTYSKSVLRVAAGKAAMTLKDVTYFPAYEIVNGPQAPGNYFRSDRRQVSAHAVEHVMRVFFRHLSTRASESNNEHDDALARQAQRTALIEAAADRVCEEELVEINSRKPGPPP